MAKLVLTSPSITIGGVDLTSYISNITLDTKYDIVETTSFGSLAKTRVAGLQDNSITLDFFQDFGTSAVEATIYPLLGTATSIVIQPVSGAASTTNPKYTISALISEWQPLKGAVGQLATVTITWPISGAITKAFA